MPGPNQEGFRPAPKPLNQGQTPIAPGAEIPEGVPLGDPIERFVGEVCESLDNLSQSQADGVWVNAIMARRFTNTKEEADTVERLIVDYWPKFED